MGELRETDRQTDRERDRQRDTERDTERETDRETDRELLASAESPFLITATEEARCEQSTRTEKPPFGGSEREPSSCLQTRCRGQNASE